LKEFDPGSYCGLYCGACEIMSAYRKHLEGGEEPSWEKMPEIFRNAISHHEIKCYGCRTDEVFTGCGGCPIRKCAKDHGLSTSCADCAEYPCELYKKAEFLQPGNRFEEIIPHIKAMQTGITTMREKGYSYWLDEQKEKWKCPGCGAQFTWYSDICKKCGKELK